MKYPKVNINPVIKYLLLPLAFVLWARYNIAVWLIKNRNKPMPIVLHPDPVLSRVADPVDFENESYKDLVAIVRQMGATLKSSSYGDKLGLAAPQIGVSKRICIVQGAVMFNPEWRPSAQPGDRVIEGCYSVPNRLFKVKRDKSGWAKWQSINGVWREQKLNGLRAIIFQHELDHLNGKCCADVGEEILTPSQ